uniref:Uncharacterized protein n=1 Tax=Clastoptera arizonana TaxID=38151 RepID=A0A1B6DVI5_9HEMI
MNLVIFCLLLVGICYTIRMPDTDLVELGKYINDTITKPRGTALQLTRDVYVYYEELHGIRKDMKLEMPYTFTKLKAVQNSGGPPYIKYEINSTILQNYFNWTRWEHEEFFGIINATEKEWVKLLKLDQRVNSKYSKTGEME